MPYCSVVDYSCDFFLEGERGLDTTFLAKCNWLYLKDVAIIHFMHGSPSGRK